MNNLKIGQLAIIKEINYYDGERLKVGDVGIILGFKVSDIENEPNLITVWFDEHSEEHSFYENELDFMEQPIPENVNPLIVQAPGTINFNYGEAKAYLINILAEYQGAVFSDDSIDTAKKIVAELRAKQKQLDALRISAKKEYLSTFEKKEVLMKDLFNQFDEPIKFIDDQIKGYEERKKAAKKVEITNLYNSLIGELIEYIPLEKIYNPKWENQTFKMKAIQEELENVIESTQAAIDTISTMKSEAVEKALDIYKKDLSLTAAITHINVYEKQKADIIASEQKKQAEELERQRQAEIEKIRREEREKIQAEQRAERERLAELEKVKEEERRATEERLLAVKTPESFKETFFEPSNEPGLEDAFEVDDTVKAIFTVYGNPEEIGQVEMYLNSIGLEFRKE